MPTYIRLTDYKSSEEKKRGFLKPENRYEAKREDFQNILMDKLPGILDINQKKNKIKNNLQALKKSGKIENIGKVWKMSNV